VTNGPVAVRMLAVRFLPALVTTRASGRRHRRPGRRPSPAGWPPRSTLPSPLSAAISRSCGKPGSSTASAAVASRLVPSALEWTRGRPGGNVSAEADQRW